MGLTFAIGIKTKNFTYAWGFDTPIPLNIKTLRYSIRNQGWLKSIRNRFIVPGDTFIHYPFYRKAIRYYRSNFFSNRNQQNQR